MDVRKGQKWRRGKRGKTYVVEKVYASTVVLLDEKGRMQVVAHDVFGAAGRHGLTLVEDVL